MLQSKLKTCPEEEVVKRLCLLNGLPNEKVERDIESLEFFFSGFPKMIGLTFFPRLLQLTIVDQKINHIEGLECCPLLQELWIVQCHLSEISGLQNCQQLVKLYLYDNQIREIKNLESQVNIEIMWLNNNCIRKIQGLKTLKHLKELNLADNLIEKIDHGLDSNTNLQILNLSGNKISSFKELSTLGHLPSLKELALRDLTSTPNPVCNLCNYATHILYHIPSLQRLDIYDVSNKQVKELAESAVSKKLMYYNMRVHNSQRNLTQTQLNLIMRKNVLLQLPEDSIRNISYALKNLERERFIVPDGYKKSEVLLEDEPREKPQSKNAKYNPRVHSYCDHILATKTLIKIEKLRNRMKFWTTTMNDVEACCVRDMALAAKQAEYEVQFLLMELESVGNIRLEEGCSTDPWFTSCSDLLLSRFNPSKYKSHNITDVKINHIFRIHNSALRIRFEDRLQELLVNELNGTPAQNCRHRLDYLFYIADPEKCDNDEIFCIIEEGFKTTRQQLSLGRKDAVPLSNSLGVTEQPRIEYLLRKARRQRSLRRTDTIPFKHGHVIVCKVFVGNSVPILNGQLPDLNCHHEFFSVYQEINDNVNNTTADGSESKILRRRWFVFDHELVLPEYIIFFEYLTQGKPCTSKCHCTERCSFSNEVELDRANLNMEPVLPPQPKLLNLDDKILLKAARANVLSQITVLNLHGNSLKKINEVSCLVALRHLTISFNELTCLEDISHMPNLEFLDASFNQLVTLSGLRGMAHLKELNLSWNKLTKVTEDTHVLKRNTPALSNLDTRHNPWNKSETVRPTILARLTTLTRLDGVLVSDEEIAHAVQTVFVNKINQKTILKNCRTTTERPRSLSLLSTTQLICRSGPVPWASHAEMEPDWASKITTLNLDNQRIAKMINLDKLVNLRWASFDGNDISMVEGLDCCLELRELSFNNNLITSFRGFEGLINLTKLSMNGNRLQCLETSVLEHLPNLTFLSMEHNIITCLHGIQKLRSLLVLYVGGNQISTSRDIYYVKGLINLIILDLHGNPIIQLLENYRIYMIFHLPSLKALDGIAVEASESESAKYTFKGRLTLDAVAEELGHSNFIEMTYLTFQSCSIRTVDLSPIDLFNNLRSVNLDHNNLTSFSGLIHLPNVKVLYLNYNHIESVVPRHKSNGHLTNRQSLYNKVHSSGYGQQNSGKPNREPAPTASLEPLMKSLEVLHLSNNAISSLTNLQLSRLTNLKALFLQDNEISQVEGLEGLHHLRELVLDGNRIKTFAKNSFISQAVLIELHLAENRIRELSNLESLGELRKLILDKNKIQGIIELDKLDVLPLLTELSVLANPVSRNSLHRLGVVLRLPQLQVLDGVEISVAERTRADLLNAEQNILPSGSSSSAVESCLPGLISILPHNTTIRGMSLNGELQSVMQRQLNNYLEKKHKCINAGQGNQTDSSVKRSRKKKTSMSTSHPKQDYRLRFFRGDNPPPL